MRIHRTCQGKGRLAELGGAHLAQAGPFAEELSVADLDEVDLVLGAEGLDELDVFGLGAGLVEDAEVSLALVERLGRLPQSSRQPVVDLIAHHHQSDGREGRSRGENGRGPS